jgi:hypothetical protein
MSNNVSRHSTNTSDGSLSSPQAFFLAKREVSKSSFIGTELAVFKISFATSLYLFRSEKEKKKRKEKKKNKMYR